jgi:hypothetical protein
LLFVVAGFVAFPEDAAACSCAGGVDPRVVLREADAAFVGTVIERRESHRDPDDAVWSSGDPVTLVFRVEESVKGDLGTLVEVETSFSGASCGSKLPWGSAWGSSSMRSIAVGGRRGSARRSSRPRFSRRRG